MKFKKFMESIMQKAGKLRALSKELKKNYSHDEAAKKYHS